MRFYTACIQGKNTSERCDAENYNFSSLLNEGETCFLLKGTYLSQGAYMKVK